MSHKLLVVDDESNIRLTLEILLREAGYEVRLASDGAQAMAALDREAPDLLLLDVMMPGPDGYDICQHVRSTPALRNTRIVMLSAKSRQIEREKGLAMGADAYIAKPFSAGQLLERIREQLSQA